LVDGYIRINLGDNSPFKFPKDILELIMNWYHLDSYFMFIGNKCKLVGNQTTVHYIGEDITDSIGENNKSPNCCYHSIIMPSMNETDIEYIYTLKILKCEDVICIGIDSTNGKYINDDFTNQKDTDYYAYYSRNGTGWDKRNASSEAEKKKYPYHGMTYGDGPFGKGDIIKMYYNPYAAELHFERNGKKHKAMDVAQRMGLQYRLCVYMGECGKQSVELMEYQRIGDIDEDEQDQNEDDNIAIPANLSDGKELIVPSNYLCFQCKIVGQHWIMQCPQNKK